MKFNDSLYSPRQVGERLGFSERTIRYWITKGLITPTYTTPGKQYRFSLEKILSIKARLTQ